MKFIKLNLLSVLFFTSFLIAQDDAVEEVVVTGSYIKGSPTDGASPVEIVSRDTIDVLNASTVADITANLTVNSGSENNTDSFTQGSTQGTTNVNLRGLGLSSTLVLIDGQRQTVAANTANDGSVFVNTSAIPVIALDRVEILKEGAASVYGSDAIAGVVNYILRKDFKGAEIDISTQETDTGGQTDNRISFIYGTDVGQGDLVVAFSQLDRSPLAGVDRPELAQLGISGFGNSFLVYPPAPLDDLTPAQYVTSVADGPYAGTYYILENVPDANCVANKGILQPQPNSDVGKALEAELGGTRCGFFYGDRFNVVNDEDHMSSYVSYSQTLSNGVDFSIDYLNTEIDVNDNPQSPSYPAGSFLSASKLILPGMAGSPFSYPVMWIGRPLGSTAPSPDAPRAIEVDRTSINFSGSLDAGYDWSLSYTNSNDSGYGKQPDISTSKFDAALAGTGGASGTEMWNLFDPLANSAELTEYIKSAQETWIESSLSVLDFVLTGSSNGFDFAGGVQFKKEEFVVERSENTIVEIGSDGSLVKPADLVFLGGGLESDDSRSSFAMFAEISKDVSDKLQVKTALRFEDLESDSTVNPKISVRYEATDDLILRGSISTSFREASLAQLTSTNVTLHLLELRRLQMQTCNQKRQLI
jgi:iron complex outermembrane receptor protein